MDAHELPWHRDPETMGGMAVFKGTRVPVKSLLENLAVGVSREDFLRNFPTVERDQFDAALEAFLDFAESTPLIEVNPARAA